MDVPRRKKKFLAYSFGNLKKNHESSHQKYINHHQTNSKHFLYIFRTVIKTFNNENDLHWIFKTLFIITMCKQYVLCTINIRFIIINNDFIIKKNLNIHACEYYVVLQELIIFMKL